MHRWLAIFSLSVAVAATYFARNAEAPELATAARIQAEDAPRPRVHPLKLIYDRIGPEQEAYRQPRCTMPGRIWWHDGCWLPEKILGQMQ